MIQARWGLHLYNMKWHAALDSRGGLQECVAVLVQLYKKNVTVSGVRSDLLSEWALSSASSQPVVIRFAQIKRKIWVWQIVKITPNFLFKVTNGVHIEK